MQTKNGIYAARKTDAGVQAVFIDEELLEHRKLNRRAAENAARQEQAAMAERENLSNQQKQMETQQRMLERMRRRFLKQELKLLGFAMIVLLGRMMGLVELGFALPVIAVIQTVVCYRAGKFVGRTNQSRKETRI